jgi:predicted DNA binding CopG/RHH family protein
MSMSTRKKRLPDVTDWTAKQIHEFWKTHSSADYWDETEDIEVDVHRRPRQPVSVKLSEEDVEFLKQMAAEKGMGYTTLLRVWIKEKLHEVKTA